jgi:hypothetical protein
MTRRTVRRVAAGAAALVLGTAATVGATTALHVGDEVQSRFAAALTGEAEVPVTGDLDGEGVAIISLDPAGGKVCLEWHITDVEPITIAHIHIGAEGVPGPIVVDLTSALRNNCVRGIDSELLETIRANPQAYYFNAHNVPFPGGAVRGQLFDILGPTAQGS